MPKAADSFFTQPNFVTTADHVPVLLPISLPSSLFRIFPLKYCLPITWTLLLSFSSFSCSLAHQGYIFLPIKITQNCSFSSFLFLVPATSAQPKHIYQVLLNSNHFWLTNILWTTTPKGNSSVLQQWTKKV